MAGAYIQEARPPKEDVRTRALSRPGWSRTATRCDICYGSALGYIVNVGRLSLVGRISPCGPPDDDICNPDTARSFSQLATKRPLRTLFHLADPAAL
jgi:hypothetical protein